MLPKYLSYTVCQHLDFTAGKWKCSPWGNPGCLVCLFVFKALSGLPLTRSAHRPMRGVHSPERNVNREEHWSRSREMHWIFGTIHLMCGYNQVSLGYRGKGWAWHYFSQKKTIFFHYSLSGGHFIYNFLVRQHSGFNEILSPRQWLLLIHTSSVIHWVW